MKSDAMVVPFSRMYMTMGPRPFLSSRRELCGNVTRSSLLFWMLVEPFPGIVSSALVNSCNLSLFGATDTEEKAQRKLCSKPCRRKQEECLPLSELGSEREVECRICMEVNSKIVLHDCFHSMCFKCYREWCGEVDECELARQQMEKMAIQTEIMSSPFMLPQKESENECGDPYSGRKYKPIHEVVYGHPPKIFAVEEKTEETKPEKNDSIEQLGKEEEEDDYQLLPKAVTEYRDTMKEYYKAAIEAYSNGDQARANKLSEKGQFFYRKGREADQESTRKVCEIRNADARDEDIFPLNLSELDAREAPHIMKLHLKSLAGSLGFKYTKVTIEGPNGDPSRGARRRRIMKLMDMKSIHWLDGGDPGTILIPLSINQQEPV